MSTKPSKVEKFSHGSCTDGNSLVQPFLHGIQHSCEIKRERGGDQDTTSLDATVDQEGFAWFTAHQDLCFHPIMKAFNNVNKLIGHP